MYEKFTPDPPPPPPQGGTSKWVTLFSWAGFLHIN